MLDWQRLSHEPALSLSLFRRETPTPFAWACARTPERIAEEKRDNDTKNRVRPTSRAPEQASSYDESCLRYTRAKKGCRTRSRTPERDDTITAWRRRKQEGATNRSGCANQVAIHLKTRSGHGSRIIGEGPAITTPRPPRKGPASQPSWNARRADGLERLLFYSASCVSRLIGVLCQHAERRSTECPVPDSAISRWL